MIKLTMGSMRAIEISDTQIPNEEQFVEWFWSASYFDMISGTKNFKNKSDYFNNNRDLCLTYIDVFYAMKIYDYHGGLIEGWEKSIKVNVV